MSLFVTIMGGLMALTALSLSLTTLRLVLGPSIPDRAVAFDMLMSHVAALIAMYAVVVVEDSLLDALVIVAVLGFLGTVAVARYIEGGRN